MSSNSDQKRGQRKDRQLSDRQGVRDESTGEVRHKRKAKISIADLLGDGLFVNVIWRRKREKEQKTKIDKFFK